MRVGWAIFLCASLVSAADVASMTGVWKLNTKKSDFEGQSAPFSVSLKIEHNEPALKYWGTVTGSQEGHPDTFEFNGAIDNKIYPVKESAGTGRTIKFNRRSDRAVESWSSDKTMEEYAVTTVERDGKSLTRKMVVKDKSGNQRTWTEVYDKQN